MEINVIELKKKVWLQSHIILYGCGEYAKKTYESLKKIDVIPDYCVISGEVCGETFFESKIPVYNVEKKVNSIRENKSLVIISVSELYQDEIKKTLTDLKINNYIDITEYDRNSMDYIKRYETMNKEDCLQEIATWYMDNTEKYYESEVNTISKIKKAAMAKISKENEVVIALAHLTPRTVKVIDGLKNGGYKINIIASSEASLSPMWVQDIEKLGFKIIRCNSFSEWMYKLIFSKAKIIHLFTHRHHAYYDKILIKFKDLFPKIVYDEYDIVNRIYKDISKDVLDNEKYCLENADAICNRGFDIEYLKKEHNYRINSEVIQFHDYCSNQQYICRNINKDNTLSLCYVGGIYSRHQNESFMECQLEFIKLCEKNKVHYHIYPAGWSEEYFKEYIECDINNEYFHFHKPLPFSELIKEITKYDYGVSLMKEEMKKTAFNVVITFDYAACNKFFDYLDAGLPIIASAPLKTVDFYEEKGVLLRWNIEDFDFKVLRERRKELSNKVLKVREELRIDNNINQLIEFYEKVLQK